MKLCQCVLAYLAQSLFIDIPRLRTDATGWTMVDQICRVVSIVNVFFKVALEPNQMTSVLSAFSWRRLDEHQSLISATKIGRLVLIAIITSPSIIYCHVPKLHSDSCLPSLSYFLVFHWLCSVFLFQKSKMLKSTDQNWTKWIFTVRLAQPIS